MRNQYALIFGLVAAIFLQNRGLSQESNTELTPTLDKKVETIIIPKVSLEKMSISQAAMYLSHYSRRHDPWGDGVMIFVWPADKIPIILVDLENKSLKQIFDAICKGTEWTYHVDTHAVVFGPKDALSIRCEAIPVAAGPAPLWKRVAQQTRTVSMQPGTMIGLFNDMAASGMRSANPKGEGVGFIHCPELEDHRVKEVNAVFSGVPLKALVAYACEGYDISCRIENHAVFFGRQQLAWTNVELRAYKLPKSFPKDPSQIDFRAFLVEHGISFTDPRAGLVARAQYHSPTGKLFLIHTPEAHKKAEKALRTKGFQIWKNRFQQGVAEWLKTEDMQKKYQSIVVSLTSFRGTPVTTVFEFLKSQSLGLDPEKNGHPFGGIALHNSFTNKAKATNDLEIQKTDDDWPGFRKKVDSRPTVTLNMHDVPLGDLIRYVLTSAGCSLDVKTGKNGKQKLTIIPMSLDGYEDFETQEYEITGSVLDRKVDLTKFDYQKWLADWGVRFPDVGEDWKATAKYDPKTGKVIVYNCPKQHARIKALLEEMDAK